MTHTLTITLQGRLSGAQIYTLEHLLRAAERHPDCTISCDGGLLKDGSIAYNSKYPTLHIAVAALALPERVHNLAYTLIRSRNGATVTAAYVTPARSCVNCAHLRSSQAKPPCVICNQYPEAPYYTPCLNSLAYRSSAEDDTSLEAALRRPRKRPTD